MTSSYIQHGSQDTVTVGERLSSKSTPKTMTNLPHPTDTAVTAPYALRAGCLHNALILQKRTVEPGRLYKKICSSIGHRWHCLGLSRTPNFDIDHIYRDIRSFQTHFLISSISKLLMGRIAASRSHARAKATLEIPGPA